MSSSKQPLLSICIPTYSRGPIIKDTLNHITDEKVFRTTDDIEIIIADNASPDNTQEVCEQFAARFPGKFTYYRQVQNVGYSANISTLMRLAHGTFVKFLNDTFFFRPGGLENVCKLIASLKKDKPLLFFGCAHAPYCPQEIVPFDSHDQMLNLVSYYSTWLGGFGFWLEDLDAVYSIQEKSRDTLIPQVAVLWELFDKKLKGVIDNRDLLFDEHSQIKKGGYNVAEVFSKVYLGMLKKYIGTGKISKDAFEKEKKRLFHDYIFLKYNDFLRANSFTKGHYFSYTADFHKNWYYWVSFLYWPFFKTASLLPKKMRYTLKNVYLKLRSLF